MLRKAAIGFVGSLVAIYIGFWIGAPTPADPEAFLAAAEPYDVRIVRDKYGVPHIFGERDRDVAFGLAFAHAEDDFETIQDVLLATRGKLATLHGVSAAKTDYLIQFMGVWDVVNAGYDTRISQQTRDHAEAYAAGLNYFAAQNPGKVAPALLPVTGKDIVAGFTFKTPLFYGFDSVVASVAEGRYGTGLDKTARLEVTNEPQPDLGSQGIAIAPARSEDSHTRLLVNSHQPLSGPVAWYEARVRSNEGWDMAGATFPGSPVILHGHGPTLGWASTVNKPDLVDVYELTLNPENNNQYLLDGQWQDLVVVEAEIDVTFFGPVRWVFRESIYRSVHGPVFKTMKGAFAIRWAGMDEMRTLEEMIAMNKARNQSDFEAALAMTAMPSINYVYADSAGNIAHYYNAMFPDRPQGEGYDDIDWQHLLPGDRSDLIWRGYKAFEVMPRTVNPVAGFVYNANNTPFEATVGQGLTNPTEIPRTMGVETHMTNRARRIKSMLGGDESISRTDLRHYKYDTLYAQDSVTVDVIGKLLAMPFEPESDLARGQELLRAWDRHTDVANRSAALAVLTSQPFVMADMRGEQAPDLTPSFQNAVDFLKRNFGRLDPAWGEVNRLVRGDESWPLSGAPDVLRAVYGVFDEEAGYQRATAGDSYIMFVEWTPQGAVSSRTVHNYGSATLDSASPHFADQAPLFASETERLLPLDMVVLEQEKTSDRRIGGTK